MKIYNCSKPILSRFSSINSFLGIVILLFGIFDTARNYTLLPIWFGYIKDIAIYILFILNFKSIIFSKNCSWIYHFFFLIIVFISPLGFLYSAVDSSKILINYFKFIEVPILIGVFSNFNIIFKYSLEKYMKYYIILSVILCFVNVFGYYVDNPIVSVKLANENMNEDLYSGRITVGQPPVAIFPVLISYIYLLFTMKKFSHLLLSWLFLFCIIISTSNTALVTVPIGLFLSLIFSKKKKLVVFHILFVILAASFVIGILPDIIDIKMYTNKIFALLSGKSDSSLEIRIIHWQKGYSEFSNFIDYFLGKGVYGYVSYLIDGEPFPIENTYVLTFLSYGIFGIVAFSLGLLKNISKSISLIRLRKFTNGGLSLCVLLAFIIHFLTLDIYFCYTLIFSFSLAVGQISDFLSKAKQSQMNLNDFNLSRSKGNVVL